VITYIDPVVAIILGVTLLDERARHGANVEGDVLERRRLRQLDRGSIGRRTDETVRFDRCRFRAHQRNGRDARRENPHGNDGEGRGDWGLAEFTHRRLLGFENSIAKLRPGLRFLCGACNGVLSDLQLNFLRAARFSCER